MDLIKLKTPNTIGSFYIFKQETSSLFSLHLGVSVGILGKKDILIP